MVRMVPGDGANRADIVDGSGPIDVMIIGGGSAGCVLASRLSEDRNRRVLLVEAGPDVRPGAVPAAIASPYPGRAYFNPDWTWGGLSAVMGASRSNAEERTVRPYEQARVLGGGSSINGIGANRGAPADYDEWDALGARGWGWSDVLPFFRKLERDLDFGMDDEAHGRDGPLPISRVPRSLHSRLIRSVEEELVRRGYAPRDDQNGAWEDGVFPIATNLDESGRRASAATVYLPDEVRRRPNLVIWTDTKADLIVMKGRRAVGARLRRDGDPFQVPAALVVVSAGALHSPALLMRSGIGPPGHLSGVGITPTVSRDGVGRNLQEHPSAGVSAYLPRASRLPPGEHYHIQAILRWSSGLQGAPSGDMHLAFNGSSGWHAVGSRIGTLFGWVNKSYSRGSLELVSPDPTAEPKVDFRFLSDRRDLSRLADSFRLAASVLQALSACGICADAFPSTYSSRVKSWLRPSRRNGVAMSLVAPMMDRSARLRREVLRFAMEGTAPLGVLLSDERLLEEHLLRNVGGVWHPCGTCRLGSDSDPDAVCDPDGFVIGAERLAVCDASLMPTIPCANLNVPVMMIAEKIAAGLRTHPRV